jgi:hypothetical protein
MRTNGSLVAVSSSSSSLFVIIEYLSLRHLFVQALVKNGKIYSNESIYVSYQIRFHQTQGNVQVLHGVPLAVIQSRTRQLIGRMFTQDKEHRLLVFLSLSGIKKASRSRDPPAARRQA